MADALPIAYLSGRYLPVGEVRISPLDRGFLFGDSAYEVIPVYDGRPLLLDAHLARLHHSLSELLINDPLPAAGWAEIVRQLADRNGGGDMGVYLQITRGADSGRDHAIPAGLQATIFGMASPAPAPVAGLRAITLADNRWSRCDIKATALLANVLARQAAAERGAAEAILLRDGEVTEGASSSVIIIEDGQLVRRPNGQQVLPGTTTDMVVRLAAQAGYACREEPISLERLRRAGEIWITSAMRGVVAVIELDGEPVGNGQPGPVWAKVAALFETAKRGQEHG